MKVLHIDSSILGDYSVSRLLSKEVIDHIKSTHRDVTVIERDLGAHPPRHLTMAVATAIRGNDTSKLNAEEKADYEAILQSINELKEADIVVIGSPMYNLSVSANLKGWIDQICQAGLTFKYTEKGPQGLVNSKPVIIASARGGIYSQPPANALDHQESLLAGVLGLVGLTDLTFVRAEGVNVSPEQKEIALAAARKVISQLP